MRIPSTKVCHQHQSTACPDNLILTSSNFLQEKNTTPEKISILHNSVFTQDSLESWKFSAQRNWPKSHISQASVSVLHKFNIGARKPIDPRRFSAANCYDYRDHRLAASTRVQVLRRYRSLTVVVAYTRETWPGPSSAATFGTRQPR